MDRKTKREIEELKKEIEALKARPATVFPVVQPVVVQPSPSVWIAPLPYYNPPHWPHHEVTCATHTQSSALPPDSRMDICNTGVGTGAN